MSVPILRLQGTWLPALRVGARLSGLLALINVATINTMRITFDHAKRQQALRERGLDFRQAKEVFDGPHLTRSDDRKDYGESRYISAGKLFERIVIIVWTPRGKARRVISMRKANDREIKKLAPHPA